MNYDAVIVGASIAGLYTGMKLARAGWKICIVDRKKQIGIPVRCGEATGNRMELSRFVEVDEQWIARDIEGLTIHHNEHQPRFLRIKQCCIILHRERFEQALAAKAREYGAEILLGRSVSGLISKNRTFYGVTIDDTSEIAGTVIIGADGCESKIGRWAGITEPLPLKDAFSSVQYRLKSDFCNDGYMHFFIGSALIPQGYLWVFPKSDTEVSIGAGTYAIGADSSKAKRFLDTFIQKNIPSAECDRLITGCVPLSISPKRLVKDNVLVIGDAARQANPLSAGGIMNTLEAADLAVQTLLKTDTKRVFTAVLKNYSTRWKKSQRRQQKVFYLLKELLLDSTDKEIEFVMDRIKGDFEKYVDRSRPFSFPVIPLVRIFFLFFRKIIRHITILFK